MTREAKALLALAAATVLMTWPQAVRLDSVPPHQDVLFSMWRLEWVAHALTSRGVHLFDANVFYPATRTLAYSDATLLEGLIAAPIIWAGAPPAVAYNVVLLAGLLSSALAMFALVAYLTRDLAAGVVAALPFAFAPYRFDHYIHLELQWAAWIPLAFLFVHRAVDRRSLRDGLLAGACVWLQFLSCLYYAVFLAPLAVVLAVLLLATDRRPNRRGALLALAAGGALAIGLAVPYARPYLANAPVLGPRDAGEILRYSAVTKAYTAAPPQNLLYGWTAGRGAPELRLFPGLVAIALAVAAFARGRLRLPLVYLAVAACALELSMGLHGGAYRFLYEHVHALAGLRAPARAAILLFAALGVLAGLGLCRLHGALPGRRSRVAVTVVAAAAMLVEYWSGPLALARQPTKPPDVYRFLRSVAPAVVLELPAPHADALPGPDPVYQFWSIYHWNPLVNGYSGYHPGPYILTIESLEHFPDDESVERIERLGTRYIVVHRALYAADAYGALVAKMIARPELQAAGAFRDWEDDAMIFLVRGSAGRALTPASRPRSRRSRPPPSRSGR